MSGFMSVREIPRDHLAVNGDGGFGDFTPLRLVQSTPDAVRFTNLHRVLKAISGHRAAGADVLGPSLAFDTFGFPFELRRWKENCRLRSAAGAAVLP